MSIRVDTSSLIASSVVIGDPGHGVLASEVSSTGEHGPGYIYDQVTDLNLTTEEVRGLITTWPASGTLTAFEDSSFEFDAPDGNYWFEYQLYVDGVATGDAQMVSITIGEPLTADADINVSITETNFDTLSVAANVLSQFEIAITEPQFDSLSLLISADEFITSAYITINEPEFDALLTDIAVVNTVTLSTNEPEFDSYTASVSALISTGISLSENMTDIFNGLIENITSIEISSSEPNFDSLSMILSDKALPPAIVSKSIIGVIPQNIISGNKPQNIINGRLPDTVLTIGVNT